MFRPGDGRDASLTKDQVMRLREQLDALHQGPANAGRPLLLEGGLQWQPMALSPQDMDFMEAKRGAARDIALALGVPPLMLGIPGDNTYANYQEANRAFWRLTVLPLVGRLFAALAGALSPQPGGLRLLPDLDDVPALSGEREARWRLVGEASFLSDAEKRELLGVTPRRAETVPE